MKPAGDSSHTERFLSRWSRLKRAHERENAQESNEPAADAAEALAHGTPPRESPLHEVAHRVVPGNSTGDQLRHRFEGGDNAGSASPEAAPVQAKAAPGDAPELPAIESLTMESDYSPFFRREVPEELRRAAVKKLFADPHFNVMDGLDTYIDDYSKPDPIPPAMLAALNHARGFLARPDDADHAPADAAPAPDAAATSQAVSTTDVVTMTDAVTSTDAITTSGAVTSTDAITTSGAVTTAGAVATTDPLSFPAGAHLAPELDRTQSNLACDDGSQPSAPSVSPVSRTPTRP